MSGASLGDFGGMAAEIAERDPDSIAKNRSQDQNL